MLLIEMEQPYEEATGDFFADIVMQATAVGGYTKIFVDGEIDFSEVRSEINNAVPIDDDMFAYIIVRDVAEAKEHELAEYVVDQYEETVHVIN